MSISNACFHHDRLQSFDDNWVDNMSSSQAKPIFFAWPFCSENMFGMFCWGSSGWLREGGESTPWTRLWAPAHSSEVFHGTRKVKSKSKSGKRSRSHRKTELEAERKICKKDHSKELREPSLVLAIQNRCCEPLVLRSVRSAVTASPNPSPIQKVRLHETWDVMKACDGFIRLVQKEKISRMLFAKLSQ